jgi:hypothetical protein
MTAERSHRFALTGHDPEGRNRTIILWQEADLVAGIVQRRVVVTLDATMNTATVFVTRNADATMYPDHKQAPQLSGWRVWSVVEGGEDRLDEV